MKENTPYNHYIKKFWINCLENRQWLIEDNTGIRKEIIDAMESEDNWKKGTYKCIVPGKLGIKKRYKFDGNCEIAITADLYRTDLPISPFANIIKFGGSDLYYLVKDFQIDEVISGPKKGTELRKNIDEVIKYFITRGYGTSEFTGNYEEKIEVIDGKKKIIHHLCGMVQTNCRDPNIINMALMERNNLWLNFFMHDNEDNFAVVDLDGSWPLINTEEITEGAIYGTGRFSRLKTIWKILYEDQFSLERYF